MRRIQLNRIVLGLRQVSVALGVVVIAASAQSNDLVEEQPEGSETALEYFPPPSEVEQRYEAALQERVTVTFEQTPLTEVLETLTELTDVPIKFESLLQSELAEDESTLSGVFVDVPLNAILSRITFESSSFEMRVKPIMYPAADGIILTISAFELYGGLNAVTRVYPVGDLCDSQSEAEQLIDLLKSNTGMYWKANSHDGGSGLMVNGVLLTSGYDDDVYEMMAYAGSISYLAGVDGLVVKAGAATHAGILDLLRMVRQAKQAMASPVSASIPTAAALQPAEEQIFTFTVPFTR